MSPRLEMNCPILMRTGPRTLSWVHSQAASSWRVGLFLLKTNRRASCSPNSARLSIRVVQWRHRRRGLLSILQDSPFHVADGVWHGLVWY